jgi:TfoX/Sxy family transcriptional regulator of competence genes
MEWKKTPEKLVKFFEEKTASIKCERRKMFGYPCCFMNGNMFIGTFGENIVLRLGAPDREKALAGNKDMALFEPRPGSKMGEYVVVPERVRNDPALFDRLLKQSAEYAGSLPPKKKRKGKDK